MFLKKKNFFLLVCPVYEPYESGGAQSFPLIVKALASKYRPIVLTEFHCKKPLIEKNNRNIILRIIPVRDNFGKKSSIYSVFSFFMSYLIIYIITIFLVFLGVKVFHFTRYCNYLISPLLIFCRILNVKVIYDCRTEINDDQIKQFSFVLKFCSYLLANSESAFNSLVKYTSNKVPIKLIINPLKIEKFNLPINFKVGNRLIKENEYIVCVGTISKRKSSIEIVNAFISAVNEIKESKDIRIQKLPKLLFVGRNDLGNNFLNLIKNYDNVDYLGSIPHKDTLRIIKLSFGTISASISEGIPRSCLESLFLKKPCLVPSCVPEFKRYCPEVCVSVDNDKDFLAFIKLIKKMILNSNFILNKNDHYPIDNHKFSIFKLELLDFYSYLPLHKN